MEIHHAIVETTDYTNYTNYTNASMTDILL
jgi:hypothetical protein